jgi:hypothetical protein
MGRRGVNFFRKDTPIPTLVKEYLLSVEESGRGSEVWIMTCPIKEVERLGV